MTGPAGLMLARANLAPNFRAHAGDLLAACVLAMKHGLGLNKILGTLHTYPTPAEANTCAAGGSKRKRARARGTLLARVAKFHAWRRGRRADPCFQPQ